jgi:phytoene desaturase
MKKSISIIGAGFSGMAAAAVLGKNGYDVNVFEKNSAPGGRAAVLKEKGFTFDMGPSWYWMPEIFDQFYNYFGKSASDFYDLNRLDPSYRIFFDKEDYYDISANPDKIYDFFDKMEVNGANKLRRFLKDAKQKYDIGVKDLVYRPGHSMFEYVNSTVMKNILNLSVFKSYDKHMRSYFKNPKLYPILQFPIIFLGAMPRNTPALYSLMNYADLMLGTWYPMGGMGEVSKAFYKIAQDNGVNFHFNNEIRDINIDNQTIKSIGRNGSTKMVDYLIGSGDYYHIEQQLLPEANRQYSDKYWDKRVLAPSALLFFVGVNKSVPNLLHHNLFFDEDFEEHAENIFTDQKWPDKPLLYVSATSKTDPSVAPKGKENLVILIPIASGIQDIEEIRDRYWNIIVRRIEKISGLNIENEIIYKKSYAINDFEKDYNAYKGNAYGLGNTLLQTAFLKPKLKSRKLSNLYYCGQLTTPGPGVPPAIISGQVVANEILKQG